MPSCDGEHGFVVALCRLLLPAAGFLAASWLPLRHGSGRLRLFASRLAQLSPLALPDGQPLQRGLVGASVLAPVPDAPPPQLHPLQERRPLSRFWLVAVPSILTLGFARSPFVGHVASVASLAAGRKHSRLRVLDEAKTASWP